MQLPENLQFISDRLHVLRDRVIVKKFEYQHPILYVAGVTLEKGVVVAVGYGRRRRQKVRFDKQMGHMSTAGALYFEDGDEYNEPPQPMKVKVGDVVEFSPREQFPIRVQYDADSDGICIRPGSDPRGEELTVIWQNSIYGVDPDESQSAALLWQASAGMDRNGNFLSGAEEWQRQAATQV